MSNASFSWDDDILYLLTLNLTIQPGTLVDIVGSVGWNKSSLFVAILDKMNLFDGQFNTNGSSFYYTAHSSWIFVDTLCNNILLNQTFDEKRYWHVVLMLILHYLDLVVI